MEKSIVFFVKGTSVMLTSGIGQHIYFIPAALYTRQPTYILNSSCHGLQRPFSSLTADKFGS